MNPLFESHSSHFCLFLPPLFSLLFFFISPLFFLYTRSYGTKSEVTNPLTSYGAPTSTLDCARPSAHIGTFESLTSLQALTAVISTHTGTLQAPVAPPQAVVPSQAKYFGSATVLK